jgi:hypothetical protein
VTHVNERSYRVALEIHIEHEGLQVHVERPCRRWQPQLSNSRRGSRGCIKKSHTRVHMGVVFQICVEKDSETEKPEHLRKYKGRVVFRGNDVVEENWDIAMFQELGSAPATMVAAKTCDLYGLLEGHVVENADATQAYTQSLLGGTNAWVSLSKRSGQWLGNTCDVLFVHWRKHCMDIQMQAGTGSSIVITISGIADSTQWHRWTRHGAVAISAQH